MMNQDFKDALAEYSKTITELNTELNDKDAEISRLNEALTADKEKNILLAASLKQAEERVEELESDLKVNASMLARQCDLARDSEQRAETAERQNAELKLKIQKAINRLADIHDHTIGKSGDTFQAIGNIEELQIIIDNLKFDMEPKWKAHLKLEKCGKCGRRFYHQKKDLMK